MDINDWGEFYLNFLILKGIDCFILDCFFRIWIRDYKELTYSFIFCYFL